MNDKWLLKYVKMYMSLSLGPGVDGRVTEENTEVLRPASTTYFYPLAHTQLVLGFNKMTLEDRG